MKRLGLTLVAAFCLMAASFAAGMGWQHQCD